MFQRLESAMTLGALGRVRRCRPHMTVFKQTITSKERRKKKERKKVFVS